MQRLALLGPQRLLPTVGAVAERMGIGQPIAAVTAGWQEREGEDAELREHLGEAMLNLELYLRTEQLFATDPDLAEAYRNRQERLRQTQDLYRVRLGHALKAARELLATEGSTELLEREREAAIGDVRRLDNEHLDRLGLIHAEFEETVQPLGRPALRRHRAQIAEILDSASALAIAGGHVVVLLNRLRLFGVLELVDAKPILAWSAGAMVLASRIVVFHDHPPQGAGNTEILEAGLGLCPGIIPFPHARRRLRLRDRRRVTLLARRLQPLLGVLLDEGAEIDWNGRFWSSPEPIRVAAHDGTVRSLSGRLDLPAAVHHAR